MRLPILSMLVFTPVAVAVAMGVAGPWADRYARRIAMAASLVCLAGSVGVTAAWAGAGATFVERATWVPSLGIGYILGVDGLSVFMLVLAAAITSMAVWRSPAQPHRPRLYFGLFLALLTGFLGVFCALDLVLFYIFWEAVFLPVYFLIAIWGEQGEAPRAAMKFLVWMLVGSLVMLLGVVGLYFAGSPHTFDLTRLATMRFPVGFQRLAFAAFFIGFAVKVPIFPFHVWLPDAYTVAPTPLTALMSASLAAMGVYGFWRIPMSVLPQGFAAFSWLVALLCVVNVIYGDLCATAQRDLKRMAAYSSMSHMGFVMFGAAAANLMGLKGSVLHTVNHGLAMAMVFFVVEEVLAVEGTRDATRLRRLMTSAPRLAAALWVASLASFGMPGLGTFPGELMILLGGFATYPVLAVGALVGVLIMAGYVFWVLSRVTLGAEPVDVVEEAAGGALAGGPPRAGDSGKEVAGSVGDLSGGGMYAALLLAGALLVLGVAPLIINGPVDVSARVLLARLGTP